MKEGENTVLDEMLHFSICVATTVPTHYCAINDVLSSKYVKLCSLLSC